MRGSRAVAESRGNGVSEWCAARQHNDYDSSGGRLRGRTFITPSRPRAERGSKLSIRAFAHVPHGFQAQTKRPISNRRRSRRENRSHRLQPVVFEFFPSPSPLKRATDSRFMRSLPSRPLRGLATWAGLHTPGLKPGATDLTQATPAIRKHESCNAYPERRNAAARPRNRATALPHPS
jgi:hypothetical protein